MFRDAGAPLPAQGARLSLWDLRWARKVDGERTKSPLAPPAPAAPSVQGARGSAPKCTHLPGGLRAPPPVGFTPSSSSRARPALRSLNALLRLCLRRRRQLEPGLSPLPQRPAPGCPWAPPTPGQKETPSLPGARFPPGLSAPSPSGDTRVRESDSTRTSPRCVGSPGQAGSA